MRRVPERLDNWIEYRIYHGMKRRCYGVNNPNKEKYKEKGIVICDKWLGKQGFINFLTDMGKRPSSKHSIDRINNDGNYEPSNCRWATITQQMINQEKRKSASGIRGICWSKRSNKWLVTVCLGYGSHYGGLYNTIDEAIIGYNKVKEKLISGTLEKKIVHIYKSDNHVEKRCRTCQKYKSHDNFCKNKNKPYGISDYCRKCTKDNK